MLAILRRLRGRVSLAALESQIAMPEQAPSSVATIFLGLGYWEMALVASEIPYEMVAPATWKAAMGTAVPRAPTGSRAKPPEAIASLGRNDLRRRAATLRRRIKDEGYSPTADEQTLLDFARASSDRSSERKKVAKAMSEARATALFPGFDFRASPRCKVLHEGRCESALLAAYARRRASGAA